MIPRGVEVVLEAHAPTNWSREDLRQRVVCYTCQQRGHYSIECDWWKSRMCWNWRTGSCANPSSCSFAHGEAELRRPFGMSEERVWRRDPVVELSIFKPPSEIRLRPGA